jgi:hypothetical protein
VATAADVLAVAIAHQQGRQRLAAATSATVRALWRQIDPLRLEASWSRVSPYIVRAMVAAQLAAVATSDDYVAEILALQGVEDDPTGRLVAEALAGFASDGRDLESLLRQPLVSTMRALRDGVRRQEALRTARGELERIVVTQVADAGRTGDGVSGLNRGAEWYVRLLSPPSCGRCALLAGRLYRSERAFLRHPRCDCVHVPVGDRRTGNAARTNPKDYFDSLSKADQERMFTKAGAQAIRDGADVAQVVNARRGMSVAGSYTTTDAGGNIITHRGRVTSGLFTTEGTTTRGFAGRRTGPLAGRKRVTPEAIYALASDREEILRLLRRFGYLS